MEINLRAILCVMCIGWTGAFLMDDPYCAHGEPLADVFCGRGPSRQDCPSTHTCHVHPADAWAVCCPIGSRLRRSNQEIDTLKKKLSNLQNILKDMKSSDKDVAIKEKIKPEVVKNAEESQMLKSKTTGNVEPRNKLSQDEMAILMTLKDALSHRKQNKLNAETDLQHDLENKGKFYDRPIESASDDVSILKALASKLSKKEKNEETVDQASSKRQENDDLAEKKSDIQPKEGKFTLFREEVLAQVEDRLLQDMDFAMKMGFTIEEILKDLQAKEKRFEELKIEEMKNEIDRLRRIRE